jgi:hypothetical protein
MKRAVMICVWSGPLPPYLPLYLLSVGANPDFDLLMISDQPPPPGLPANVRWHGLDLAGMMGRFETRLGCHVADPSARKLCDFKPTFGHVFHDLIEDYPFWAHTDCDLFLGDLSRFLTPQRLSSHELVMLRGREFLHGPLAFFVNNEKGRTLFKRTPDWEATLCETAYCEFDEHCGRPRIRENAASPEQRIARGERVSMTDIAFTEAAAGRLALLDEDWCVETPHANLPLLLRYEDGRLFDHAPFRLRYRDRQVRLRPQLGAREVAFYHLIYAKRDPGFHIPDWDALPSRFTITRHGFADDDGITPVKRARAALPYLSGFPGRALRRVTGA